MLIGLLMVMLVSYYLAKITEFADLYIFAKIYGVFDTNAIKN
jgi:hypothetical protein